MILEVKNISVYYDSVLALQDVSMSVKEGEIVAIIGPNGAGKSTLLKAICGIIRPSSGEILFKGENIVGKKPYELVRKGLCLVPEGRRIFYSMTVLENLQVSAYIRNDPEIEKDIEKVFELFPQLKKRMKHKAGFLSAGEQQMLAIGRALMMRPQLLLMDEPSIGLSPNYVEIVFEKIKEINREGITFVIVEQNVKMALEYADVGYVFDIGKIALSGKAKELVENEKVKRLFLG